MKTRRNQRIQIDDLEIGTCMTVFKNHFRAAPSKRAPESDFLKGAVMRVKAMNLPYIFVHVTDPLRGRQSMAVDVRYHIFMPLNEDYAQAILAETPEPSKD